MFNNTCTYISYKCSAAGIPIPRKIFPAVRLQNLPTVDAEAWGVDDLGTWSKPNFLLFLPDAFYRIKKYC